MVNKKEIEVLNEILLRMSYELGKTLSENKSILNEQPLPIDYYYYDSNGNLKTLPNLVSNYPAGSTPAKKVYPSIVDGSKYPKQRMPGTNLSLQPPILKPYNWKGKPRPEKPREYNGQVMSSPGTKLPRQPWSYYNNNLMNREDANNRYKTDLENWGVANFGPKPSPPLSLNQGAQTLRDKVDKYVSYYDYLQDLEKYKKDMTWTWNLQSIGPYMKELHEWNMKVDPDYAQNYNLATLYKQRNNEYWDWYWNEAEFSNRGGQSWEHQRDKTAYPLIDNQINRTLISGKRSELQLDQLYQAMDTTEKREEEEYTENMSTIHTILQYGSMALTVVALTAGAVLSGGLATPALVTYASGIGLSMDLIDAGLYVYEGKPREAALTLILGAVDSTQLYKGMKGLKGMSDITETEIKNIRSTLNANKGKTLDALRAEGKLSSKQISVAEEIIKGTKDSQILKVVSTNMRKLATKALTDYAVKSGPKFISSVVNLVSNSGKLLTGVKNVAKYAIIIDGIQYSYNELYNIFSGEDKESQSIILSLINASWSEVEPQIIENNKKIEQSVEEAASSVNTTLDTEGLTVDPDEMLQRLNQLEKRNIPQEERTAMASAVKNKYVKYNLPTTGFKTKEEGNDFRKWFNERFKSISKYLELDLEGPHDNSFIRTAYHTEFNPNETIGQLYLKEKDEINNYDDTMGDPM
jgi:hypothetical protein